MRSHTDSKSDRQAKKSDMVSPKLPTPKCPEGAVSSTCKPQAEAPMLRQSVARSEIQDLHAAFR
eukprot:CAMPEP_0115057786 /NCGR_PEP_ID=MMETSP0227-20121206/5964_1 /TAXON_ID=89957 /ORGANISM="Polarella glacialis, Strain CCMP 1383" /LENGTH=63 /DNA_ID=CAMNT_0002442653 /DNA_START=307 /DNA_END=498 /DNA_ORIENTATION=-